jgi:predicted nuclease of restriction endonuclease-like (RecB) superfamily
VLPDVPDGYPQLLQALKTRIRDARVRAASSVNGELIALYWQIGQEILLRQKEAGWGSKVADRLSGDLRNAFPNMRGFSKSNLMYMRKLAAAWPAGTIFPQLVGKLAWGGHHEL